MTIPALTSTPAKLADLFQARTLQPLAGQAQSGVASGKTTASDAKKAASQFEAIILRQLLKPSIEPMMSGGSGGGAGGSIYGYMLTDSLANSLSAAGGLGLSRVLEKQFSQRTAKAAPGNPLPQT